MNPMYLFCYFVAYADVLNSVLLLHIYLISIIALVQPVQQYRLSTYNLSNVVSWWLSDIFSSK